MLISRAFSYDKQQRSTLGLEMAENIVDQISQQ